MSDITSAIKQICEEKNLSYDAVVETIESALAAAYRKDFGEKNQNIKVEFEPETGKSKVYDIKTVVEDLPEEELAEIVDGGEVVEKEERGKVEKKGELKKLEEIAEAAEEVKKFNPKTELQIKDAKLIKKTVKIGDELKTKLEVPAAYGRMAAQTAKQVIIQRLREAERDTIFNEFKDKEKEVISGVVQRREGAIVLIDLGKAVGVLPPDEQIYGERYNPGDRIKIYVKEVRVTSKGPEIVLSRTSDEILKKIFYLEIPEISNGLIELKAVAREAGARAKVAVFTNSDKVDPIGSCVGQRGARIQTIIQELGGEKVDIIQYDEDPIKFITNALSPAKIIKVDLHTDDKKATVMVAEDQLSLAIGRGGQNARLAARMTGWKIDIVSKETDKAVAEVKEEVEEKTEKGDEKKGKEKTEKKTKVKKSKKTKKEEKDAEPGEVAEAADKLLSATEVGEAEETTEEAVVPSESEE
jgi:N utilization substance protein A